MTVDLAHGLGYIALTTPALVAELVDALVSGTSVHKTWRFESSPGHQVAKNTLQHHRVAGFFYAPLQDNESAP